MAHRLDAPGAGTDGTIHADTITSQRDPLFRRLRSGVDLTSDEQDGADVWQGDVIVMWSRAIWAGVARRVLAFAFLPYDWPYRRWRHLV
ncbi:hypothetical protein ASE90_07295 [Sphingomonas sp. Leaf67]|uniref:hypothetical protein n=1 Tax=Sphingomonas sp. Leaf67 TaxID=1736230 RepID=UPI0006F37078|nr:hypothetical protein [Sphingomonas sp. Leaf67]KQN83743.1 hypothetical protein ASE90_07295 [Sphingomonas sp. Leaf67]